MSDERRPPQPSTFFLPADRAAPEKLDAQISWAMTNPVIDGILSTWSGAAAVLNPQRQIVALNARYLDAIGVADPAGALGLRPGEAVGCNHAHELPGGCGTAQACATCGAAIAIVAAMARERPEERDCVVTVPRDGKDVDIDLKVHAAPLDLDGQSFTLLTLADVSLDRRRAALERAFFHDLSNLVAGLSGACELLVDPDPVERAGASVDLRLLVGRLSREVQMQRAIASARPGVMRLSVERVQASRVVEQMKKLFQHHPAASGKSLVVELPQDPALDTDGFLLHRIVTNMLVNAFEATAAGGLVKLVVQELPEGLSFRVWNAGSIPASLAPRIFHRYFSTKAGEGRGHGTFVMKLFGESYLRGQMGFTTSAEGGTAFELRLPRSLGQPAPPAWARGAQQA
jgi:signal transduction histidine kinase